MRADLKIMGNQCRKLVMILLSVLASTMAFAQPGIRLEFDACVRNDTMFVDLFATDTAAGGSNLAFGGANFVFDVIDPATNVVSGDVAMGNQIKIDSLDGPWDNSGTPNTANGDYFNMTVNTGVTSFANVTIVPDEANNLGTGPNTGFVMAAGVRYQIAQVALPVLNCGTLVSLRWRTEVTHPTGGGGVINAWGSPGTDIRNRMGFHNLENIYLCNNLCAASLLTIVGDDSVCTGGTGTYTIPQASNGDSIYWFVNDTLVQSGTTNSFTHTFNGIDSIRAEVANTTCSGCPRSITYTYAPLYINPPITVDAGTDTTVQSLSPLQLNGTGTNAITFSWSPGAGLDDSTIFNPIATLTDTTELVLFGYGADPACFGTDTVIINIIPNDFDDLIVRNFVSPNGDSSNDFWTVNDTTIIAGCDVRIYSRWGITVYQSVGYQNDWDGTSDGKPVSDGTYYYVISCDGFEKTGAITLVR